jgi:hypothetical protein
MAQITRAGGGRYVPPIKSDGTAVAESGHGRYTLAANTTYYYILGGAGAPFQSVQITGYTAGLVITTATIQDTNHHDAEVTDISATVGEWVNETPASGDVQVDGTGWTSSTAIVSASGAGVGGAVWHLAEMSTFRVRLEVVVGATGGDLRVSSHGKA